MARKPDDRRECFAAIGEALTEWSYMELSLAKLFCAAASAIDDEAAYRAFWTALSFEGKLKMTDAAMQVVGDDSIREQWSELLDSLRSKAKKRNEIAHGTVMTFHGEHSTKTRHVPYLWSDTHEILETEPGPPKNAMSIDQIEEAAAQFKDASEAIAATTREILRLRAKDRLQGPAGRHRSRRSARRQRQAWARHGSPSGATLQRSNGKAQVTTMSPPVASDMAADSCHSGAWQAARMMQRAMARMIGIGLHNNLTC